MRPSEDVVWPHEYIPRELIRHLTATRDVFPYRVANLNLIIHMAQTARKRHLYGSTRHMAPTPRATYDANW